MEHSSVQVATALRLTSVVMETGTAGIWVMRCIVHLGSLVAVIVLRASLNVEIICVWTREICVMGQMTVETNQMRAPVSAVSGSRVVNYGLWYWERSSLSRLPDAICHLLTCMLLSFPHLSFSILHAVLLVLSQLLIFFCRPVMFIADSRNTVAHFV